MEEKRRVAFVTSIIVEQIQQHGILTLGKFTIAI